MFLDSTESRPVWRTYFFSLMIAIGLTILVVTLGYRQLLQGAYWTEQMAQGSTRVVKLPAPRGKILDRNNVVLVDNRPSYNVALYLDEFGAGHDRKKLLKSVRASVEMLKSRMKMPVHVNDKVVKDHYDRRGPLPLTVWNDLSPAALAAFSERSPWTSGVDLQVVPVRLYPFGTLAGHLLGYVGKPETTQQEQELNFDSGGKAFSQPSAIGKAGIEEAMDKVLQGTSGQSAIRLNAEGLKEAEVRHSLPTAGNNVVLTIDQEMQAIVEETFIGYRGACVLLDPNTGDILAMASMPAYDPNLFIPAIKKVDWQRLVGDEDKPLLNRAIQGAYHPGSTFKVITALAGLEAHSIEPSRSVGCDGMFYLGSQGFACWQKGGHGDMNLKQAITESCNVYFYTLGRNMVAFKLWEMAEAFGIGQKTGLPLDHEDAGLLGSDQWKRKHVPREHGWTTGDSVNMAIGQGYLDVTPLQMALVAGAFANGGTLYRPRMVSRIETSDGETVADFEPEIVRKIPASPENIKIIREAMLNVVLGDGGTGKAAGQPKIKIAGKTGSAQAPVRGVKQTMTWMISFAPYDNPRYAMALLAEKGDSGGHTCAPFVGTIYKRIFDLEEERKQPKRPTAVVATPVSEKIAGFEGEVSGELMGNDPVINETNAAPESVSPEPAEEVDPEAPPASLNAEKVEMR